LRLDEAMRTRGDNLSKGILAGVLTAILLAAIAAGCGGGDDSSSSSDTGGDETAVASSKAKFIKEADAICGDANEQSEKEAKEFAEDNDFELEKATEEELEGAIADVLVPSLNRQAEELAALGAPQGDEEQVEAITASLETAAAEIEDDPSLVFKPKVLQEPRQLAEEYGFKVCGGE
jgi:hypothetical protein